MAINNVINLASTSPDRIDALNTIRYTLLLDYHVPAWYSGDMYMEDLFHFCNQCCKGLFSSSDRSIQFDFFGLPKFSPESPLAHFNFYNLSLNFIQASSLPGIPDLILQHCVISSYHALMTELMSNHTATSYQIVNKIKSTGLFHLYKKGKLQMDASGINLNFKISGTNSKHSSPASDFIRKTISHQKVFPELFDTLVLPDNGQNIRYNLQFANLSYTLFNTSLSMFNTSTTQNCIEQMQEITKQLAPSFNLHGIPDKIFHKYGGEPVDGIYYYYLIERIFNLHLTYSLLKQITDLETNTNYKFSDNDTLKILSSCRKLPNVFSRQYFIKYAFDAFIDMPQSYIDFWHHQALERSGIFGSSTRQLPQGFQFAKWLEQYWLFVNYMADFVIPVYEWCFLNMLLESIENAYPEKSHLDHILQALDCLSSYINANYQSILQPIPLKKDMEIVSINAKIRNWLVLGNLSPQTLNFVRNEMFLPQELFLHESTTQQTTPDESFTPEDSKDTSTLAETFTLNLHLLNPAFFKSGAEVPVEKNIDRIRKFYIDLVRYSHLKK